MPRTWLLLIVILSLSPYCTCLMSIDEKCLKGGTLESWWMKKEPYVEPRDLTPVGGLLIDIISDAVKICCHKNTKIKYSREITSPHDCIENREADFIVPVGAKTHDTQVIQLCPYIGFVESPGVAVLMARNVSGTILISTLIKVWPILLFILISASLSGVVIWLLEKRENTDFPMDFGPGIFEGFWWSFVTMTTVGYGDRCPKTLFGKCFGLVWMLAGYVIIAIFIGIITSVLTSINLEGKGDIRRVKIAAVNQSEEHRVAIQNMAIVQALPSLEEVFDHVKSRSVEGALVDLHSLKHHLDLLRKYDIQIAKLIIHETFYGLTLSPHNSSRIEKCFRNYVEMQEGKIFQLLRAYTGGYRQNSISVTEDYFGGSGIFGITVYSGSALFIVIVTAGCIIQYYLLKSNRRQQSGAAESSRTLKES